MIWNSKFTFVLHLTSVKNYVKRKGYAKKNTQQKLKCENNRITENLNMSLSLLYQRKKYVQ